MESEVEVKPRRGAGRPATRDNYTLEMADKMVEWFKARRNPIKHNVDNYGRDFPYVSDFPSFYGFASEIEVSEETMLRWKEEHDSFEDAWNRCKSHERAAVVNVGMAGLGGKFLDLYVKTQLGWMPKEETDGRMPTLVIAGQAYVAPGIESAKPVDIESAMVAEKKELQEESNEETV